MIDGFIQKKAWIKNNEPKTAVIEVYMDTETINIRNMEDLPGKEEFSMSFEDFQSLVRQLVVAEIILSF